MSENTNTLIEVKNLSVFYGKLEAVKEVSIEFKKNQVAAIIGPSGCGKSTLLRTINRMNDFIDGVSYRGDILLSGESLLGRHVEPTSIRRQIGMVFQKPNPFPKTIYDNVAWGPRVNRLNVNLNNLVEESLIKAALWDEVKDRLNESALKLSGGQQQRLCIARAIAMSPSVILMDEPCSALDPIATTRIEELIAELKSLYTIVIVTHNMQQAKRTSDETHFLYGGELVESGMTEQIFKKPQQKKTEAYISGQFG